MSFHWKNLGFAGILASAFASFAPPASATQITYTETANVTGVLNGAFFFPEARLTLTTTADTSSIVGASTPEVYLSNPTIYFTLSGIGSGVFTDETYLRNIKFESTFAFFDYPSGGPTAYAILGLDSPALASYDLSGPIGPVAGEQYYSFAVQFPTSAGNLQIDYIDGDVTLTATTAVPEPSTWATMVLGFAGLGYAGWRGSRKTAARVA
jgi:hypothetical protein